MDLLPIFRALTRPSSELGATTFHVAPISGFTSHRLGKDGTGAPALLVGVKDSDTRATGPVVLQHLSVLHGVRCRIVGPTTTAAREETFSLVRRTSGEPMLREYFVRAVELAVRQLGEAPTPVSVNRAIKRLVELFQAFEQPARRTVQGLWAELLVIDLSHDPGALLSAWHVEREEAFDFAMGPNRLEVKSFSGPARVHTFALRQVRPGPGIDVVIASVRAERSTGGLSVVDLMRNITERGITEGAVEKLETVVAASLGSSSATALGLVFDVERARCGFRPMVNARIGPS
jgi:hypothetical protein